MATNDFSGFSNDEIQNTTIDYQPVQQDECAVQPVNSTTSLIITATTNNVTYCQTATATQSVHGNATYKSALYDTKQNANVQPTYPNLLQYTPYQMTTYPSYEPVPYNQRNNVNLEKNVIYMFNGCPISLYTSYKISEFDYRGPPRFLFLSSLIDLTSCENRMKTFSNSHCKSDFLVKFNPEKMSKAGFYCMDIYDLVKCAYCYIEMDNWRHNDDPYVEHLRKSPGCPIFKNFAGYDVCGPYNFPHGSSPQLTLNNDAQKMRIFLDFEDVVHQIQPLKYKAFVDYLTRLKTFEKCQKKMKQDTKTLCEAGFFYIGDGKNDYMLCFCCSQGLRDWEDDDEPWIEHARWSPRCSYLLLCKGKHFVDKACGKRNNASYMNHRELVSNQKEASLLVNMNSTKRNSDELDRIQIRNAESKLTLPLSEQTDSGTVPDDMLCKICFTDEMKIAFLPCGHIFTCVECAIKLEHCPVCRESFKMVMRVYLHVSVYLSSSTQCSDEPLDSMLCKVCRKDEMDTVFIPCRHVYACLKCAATMQECPVCSEAFCAFMQVFL